MNLRYRLILASSVLVTGSAGHVGLAHVVSKRSDGASAELAQPLRKFPERLGSWVGVDSPLDPNLVKHIKIDDHLHRTYTHPSGQTVVLWMSFSRKSLDQYHYPTVCMQGNGWREEESLRSDISLGTANESEQAVRFMFHRPGQTELVYYWYYLMGEDPLDSALRKLSQTARGFLRGRRNASMTVELFSQSPIPDEVLLDDLARRVKHELEAYMPEGTEIARALGAIY